MNQYTKGEWLRQELSDLVRDVIEIERSTLPLFNKGLEVKCAIDTKLGKILDNKEVAPDMYEALKDLRDWLKSSDIKILGKGLVEQFGLPKTFGMVDKALAKAEGKQV